MLELSSKKLDLKFNEKIYNLRYPTVKELRVFSKTKSDDQVEEVVMLLKAVGLPEKVCNQLEVDHMRILVEELTTTKK